MFQIVVCAAAVALCPCQSGWTDMGDASPPPEAFLPGVGPATLPRRPEPTTLDEAEFRILTPLLTNDAFAERTRLFIDGWLAQSYNFNPYSPPTKTNGPVGYMDRANEYQLNQFYLRLGRDIDPTRERFDVGGQVDLLYGTDAEFFQASGLDERIILDHRYLQMAVPQLYGAVFLPLGYGNVVKIGKFYTPFGLDAPTAVGGFFPTKSYARLYGEPFTLTGVLTTQQFGDQWSVAAGAVRGWDSWTDNNNGLSGLVSVAWRSCDRWTRFSLSGIGGPEQDEGRDRFQGVFAPAGSNANRWLVCATAERRLTEKLRAWTQGDWGYQEDAMRAGPARWYGAQQGLAYTFNDCLTVGWRGEWFRDDGGVRVVPLRTSQPQPWGGTPADYFALSVGAQVHLNMWATIRPELRFDWQRRDDPLARPAFDGGRRSQQFLAVVDLVMRF